MASQKRRGVIAFSLLVFGCGATASVPALVPPDSGSAPVCPSGPQTPTASASGLPDGGCTANEGPCDYIATPCPTVVNGTVNGYVCLCQSGTWSCSVVNQAGLCSPLPDYDGGPDASYLTYVDGAPPQDATTLDAPK